MERSESRVSDLQIAYIGGGSRGWAWGLMSDLALEPQLSGTVRLYDIDRQAAADNEIIGNLHTSHPDARSQWRYRAVDSLAEALVGADFVVISIQPGSYREMQSDVHQPEKYGIYQSVGDTTGPGGIIRALRTIPMYVGFAQAIREHCPNAWVINYTNPMTLCTRTLYAVFPEIKAFGCCHEVFGTQRLLAQMLHDQEGIPEPERHEIQVNVLGINHFTWLDEAQFGELDLMPLYKNFVSLCWEKGFEPGEPGQWRNSVFGTTERVKFDLFKRYGLIAAAGDRHLAEFCPPWYLKNPKTVEEWMFHLTPVSFREECLTERLEIARELIEGTRKVELKKTGEEGVRQIKAIVGLGDIVTNVNLPNRGQIVNLQQRAVVETNAVFSRNSVRPVMAGQFPDEVRSLVQRQVTNQETTLQAALHKNKELAFKAFANDPLVVLSMRDARQLFEEMLRNTSEFLPGWELDS